MMAVAGLLVACSNDKGQYKGFVPGTKADSVVSQSPVKNETGNQQQTINVQNVLPNDIVNFAETLVGIPYKYASSDPNVGFDCSGFISYVYHHFNIEVPRSSVDFTNVGTEIPLREAQRGDLILFTGTNDSIRVVGHMGIVTNNKDSLHFIHATSGKQYAVTVTALNDYYLKRFVKITRL